MSLESQLSLTMNGGVYYEGTRVTPTDDPILFVGLGGTGIDALLRIKNEVQTRMPLPKGSDGKILGTSPNNIGFLALDTDEEVLKKTWGVAGFNKTGDEFINLSVDGLPQVISTVIESHLNEPKWSWFDHDLTGGGGAAGANGYRQIGRFMLFQKIDSIADRFARVIEKILKASMIRGTNSLKIFILSGIGGGTGSGTFLDIAYMLRKIAREKTTNVELHGYIFTPDLNSKNGGDKTSMYRNGFAALKELDYWMSGDEHKQAFVQEYSDTFRVNTIDQPFDYCHIITGRNEKHNPVSYDEAMSAVGNNLFAYIVSEQANASGNTALKEMYDNIRGHINTASKPIPANYRYLSVGSDKFEIPYTEITTLIAARVFERLDPMFRMAPDMQSFDRDIRNLQMTQQHLWGYIHKEILADPIQGRKLSYNEIWPQNNPFMAVNHWMNSHVKVLVHRNAEQILDVYDKLMRDYFTALMMAPDRGPCYAARMISSASNPSLIPTLEGFRNQCRESAAACAAKLPTLKSELEQAFNAGRGVGVLGKGGATRDYSAALTRWMTEEANYWAYLELGEAINKLAERLKLYYERIFKVLLDSLCQLPGIFHQNVATIVTKEQEAQKNPDVARHYLIRPIEFERMYQMQLSEKVMESCNVFAKFVTENLSKWTGRGLIDVESDFVENTDISGEIARFVNENFSDMLALRMEPLLLKKAPAGMDAEEYIRERLDELKRSAVSLYEVGVSNFNIDKKEFSMISVPNDCEKIFSVANRSDRPKEEKPKFSSERSKLQWVKVTAGMPLFTFPEVVTMEEYYERAMTTSRESRRGVHLRWEWREELPSPLPEASWSAAQRAEAQKTYTKSVNERFYAAFDKCRNAGIIRPAESGAFAKLYVADENILANLNITGNMVERKAIIAQLNSALWSNESTVVRLDPFGNGAQGDMLDRVKNNVVRFRNITRQVEKQAEILDSLDSLQGEMMNVECYVNAYFANLMYEQGFSYMFRRAKLDVAPVKLFDKTTAVNFIDYELFKSFVKILDRNVAENIEIQTEQAKDELIGPDGGFIEGAVAEKVAVLEKLKARLQEGYQFAQNKKLATPKDQMGELQKVIEFYEQSIEIVENRLRLFR